MATTLVNPGPQLSISVRVADIGDDAVVAGAGPDHALLVLSPWLHPGQRVALTFFVADELRRRPNRLPLRFPTGRFVAQTPTVGQHELLDLMDKPELSIPEWERLIDMYLEQES